MNCLCEANIFCYRAATVVLTYKHANGRQRPLRTCAPCAKFLRAESASDSKVVVTAQPAGKAAA